MLKNKILPLSILLILLIIIAVVDIGKRVDRITEQKTQINAYNELKTSLSEYQKEYGTLKKPILPKSELANFADDLKTMAKKSNVTLTITNNEAYFEHFTINIDASYTDLIKFLNNMSKSPYPVQLTSFDIQRNGKKFTTIINGRLFSQ